MENYNVYGNYGHQTHNYMYSNDYYALQHHYNQLMQTTMYDQNRSTDTAVSNHQQSTSANDDAARSSYEASISPVPSAPINSTDLNFTPLTNTNEMVKYYPTPPSDESFVRENVVQNVHNTSPDVIPHDDSLENYSGQSKSKRRTRTQFNKYQVDCLEAVFNKNHYPDVQTVDRLSDTLGLAIERISVWFQNRRAKFKKTKKPMSMRENKNYNNYDFNKNIGQATSNAIIYQNSSQNYQGESVHVKQYNGPNIEMNGWPYFKPDFAAPCN